MLKKGEALFPPLLQLPLQKGDKVIFLRQAFLILLYQFIRELVKDISIPSILTRSIMVIDDDMVGLEEFFGLYAKEFTERKNIARP